MVYRGHIIEAIYQPDSFELTDDVVFKRTEREVLKTKTKETTKNVKLLPKMRYTADWCITFSPGFISGGFMFIDDIKDTWWNNKSPSIVLSNGVWFVDVKGSGQRTDDGRYFRAMQKITFDKHNIYVQKLVISNCEKSFFNETFTPDKFTMTNKSGKPRSIKYRITSVTEFIGRLLF